MMIKLSRVFFYFNKEKKLMKVKRNIIKLTKTKLIKATREKKIIQIILIF